MINLLGTTNAGHIIIQQKEENKEEGVVLAYKVFKIGEQPGIQFVTWVMRIEFEKPSYYWGHYYFNDLRVALEDFEKRN